MFISLLLSAAAAAPAPPAPPVDCWPGFRGDGSGVSAASGLPLTWSPTENVAWRADLPGYGQSSPVVWKDRVYVTAVEGKEKETCLVVALDAATGKRVWVKEFRSFQKGKNNPMTSRAAPTPAVDANGVYAFFESGDVFVLSHEGELLWDRALAGIHGPFDNEFGLAASVAQTDRAFFVLVEHKKAAYLSAFDKATGKTLWVADRAPRVSWASPVAARWQGRDYVVVSSSGAVTGYDAASGAVAWEVTGLVGNAIPSATVAGDRILVGAGENGLKPDRAGSVRSNCCLKLTEVGGRVVCERAWEAQKALSDTASPLAYGGHVYFVTKTGIVHCLDLVTGEERYAERLHGPCWATPIGADGRVYFFGKDGVTAVLKAGRGFEALATNRLWTEQDFARRKEEARKRPENQIEPPKGAFPPAKKSDGPGGEPPRGSREAFDQMIAGSVGDIVYGVAAVDRTFYVRTGTELICVRAGR
jgi:outer membrane protein assembly factor BamB